MYYINCFAKTSFFYVLAKYIISNFIYQKHYSEFMRKKYIVNNLDPKCNQGLKKLFVQAFAILLQA